MPPITAQSWCHRGTPWRTLTVLALALLDLVLVLDVLVAGLAVVPGPLHLKTVSGDEEAHRVGRDLGAPRVDGDLGVAAVVRPHLQGKQEQLQLHEAEPRKKNLVKA